MTRTRLSGVPSLKAIAAATLASGERVVPSGGKPDEPWELSFQSDLAGDKRHFLQRVQ